MNSNILVIGLLFWFIVQSVSASTDAAAVIAQVVCCLIPQVVQVAWALAILMFIYGGAKYAYSADDPGARKKAKTIAVQAIIGFLIVAVSKALVETIAGTSIGCNFTAC